MEKEKIKSLEKKSKALGIGILLVFGISYYIYSRKLINSIALPAGIFLVYIVYSFFNKKLAISKDVRKMELVFPDFIGLVASNLRAGMTLDKALLISSRKEFAPLDSKILL